MDNFEYEKQIQRVLSPIEDVELILLKGHLIIEQLITKLLELDLVEANRLNSISPMFSKKLEMYLAINGNSIISSGLEILLKDLNSLRNKLAHKLEPPNFNRLLNDWIQRALKTKIESLENNSNVKPFLIGAISVIAAFLSGAIDGKQHVTNKDRS